MGIQELQHIQNPKPIIQIKLGDNMWKKNVKDQRLDQEEETNIIPFKTHREQVKKLQMDSVFYKSSTTNQSINIG